jgi:hypothetical protein
LFKKLEKNKCPSFYHKFDQQSTEKVNKNGPINNYDLLKKKIFGKFPRTPNYMRSRGVFSSGVSRPWFSNGFAAGDADPLRIRPG